MCRMMKRAFLLLLSMVALCACNSANPPTDAPATDAADGVAAKPQNYVALPGQAATASTVSDTTRAFEYAAAAYNQPAPQAAAPAAAPIPEPRPVASTGMLSADSSSYMPPAGSGAPYAVQLTNGTPNRLYVEAQDEGNNIFPFGFMYSGQRIGAQPQEARAIQGRLIIVVRDPDRHGAPELRRYFVEPPPHYEGKTIGITVLPGGRYRVTLDGAIYYESPDPSAPAA